MLAPWERLVKNLDLNWLVTRFLAICPPLLVAVYLLIWVYWFLNYRNLLLGSDFVHFWAASSLALSGEAAAVYDPARLYAVEQAVTGPGTTIPWLHPPTFLLLVLPLSLVPHLFSLAAWLFLTGLGYLTVMRRIAPHPFAGGFLLGLLSYKPQWWVLIPLALMAGRQWKALGAMLSAVLVLALASAAVLGYEVWQAFFSKNLPFFIELLKTGKVAAGATLPLFKMPTVFAALSLTGAGATAAVTLQAAAALGAAAAAWCWHQGASLPCGGRPGPGDAPGKPLLLYLRPGPAGLAPGLAGVGRPHQGLEAWREIHPGWRVGGTPILPGVASGTAAPGSPPLSGAAADGPGAGRLSPRNLCLPRKLEEEVMDFSLSTEQQAVQEKARRLAQQVKEEAARLDREGTFPREILELWAQAGFFGLALPRDYGGGGLDYVTYALAQMELAQACTASALILHVNHTLFGMTLNQFGTPEQKKRFLPPTARGEVYTCFALTEPEAGSDPARLTTRARQEGEGWVLSGQKNFVTSGHLARFALVAASTDPERGAKGISAFVVDLPQTPGITRGPLEDKLGLRGAGSVPLVFDEARLPRESLLGEANQGLKVMLAALDAARVGSSAIAVGLGRAVLAAAISYAHRREQFGQPIAQFQATQWKLADLACDLEAAALLTLKAAWLRDQNLPYGTAAAMAKRFATDTAMHAALEGVQILGGYGYLKDYPMERYFRDAKAGQIYEGTNEIMRLIIARELLKGGGG